MIFTLRYTLAGFSTGFFAGVHLVAFDPVSLASLATNPSE
jgi:hypothetical protein